MYRVHFFKTMIMLYDSNTRCTYTYSFALAAALGVLDSVFEINFNLLHAHTIRFKSKCTEQN